MSRVGVLGAGGRMGAAVAAAVLADPALTLAGAVETAGHPAVGATVGATVGGLTIGVDAATLAGLSDVLIDFTVPAALAANLAAARAGHAAILIGTTGLGPDHHAAIDRAARDIAVLQTANTSVGVAVLARLVAAAAAALPDWDIDILDLHHRAKRDAPSGTALILGAAAAQARGTTLAAVCDLPRHEAPGGIGFAALRGGSAAGEHMVLLAGDGERIELHHKAEGRDLFAAGAVRAAAWLVGRAPGRYTMDDVLGDDVPGGDVLAT
jgi:4-hydroxy-tetrahydrodipicolinate reductase